MKLTDVRHLATFENSTADAKKRADWCLNHYLARGGLIAALMFDRAAEEQQIAAGREVAARRYVGMSPT